MSCNTDESSDISYEILPVVGGQVPSDMSVNNEYNIGISFTYPTNCHVFSDIFYEIEGDTRTIAIVAIKNMSLSCVSQTSAEHNRYFTFTPEHAGTHTFKFWTGKDPETGEDLFEVTEVTVTE